MKPTVVEELRAKDRKEKVAGLEEILKNLEAHMKAARQFMAQNRDQTGEAAALGELYQQAYDEALSLKERAHAGDDDDDRWEVFEETYGALSRTLSRLGTRNWIDRGPTNSRRLNQLFFFCETQRVIKSRKERANLINDLQTLTSQFLTDVEDESMRKSLIALQSALRAIVESQIPNLTKFTDQLMGALEELSQYVELTTFDQPTKPEKTWLENFRHLAEAVSLGEVEAQYLFQERDLAVQRIETLLPVTFAAGSSEELPEILVDVVEHLGLLEEAFANEEDFYEWDLVLAELWAELEEAGQETQTTTSTACAVCGATVPVGVDRCPSCKSQVLNLEQAQVKEVEDTEGGTGSKLLDELEKAWSRYRSGSLGEQQMRAKFESVQRKIDAVLRASGRASANQAPAPQVTRGLQDFNNKLEVFAESETAALGPAWRSVMASGQNLIQEMMKHGQ